MSVLANTRIVRFPLLLLLLTGVGQIDLRAADWNGWMGSKRDGVFHESGVIESIPEAGLNVKWRMPIAGGYAGPAVADGRVFVFDYLKEAGEAVNNPGERANLQGQERLTAFDEKTGKQLWQHAYDCPYSISYPAGPRCTPTVDGDLVYILGSESDLRCLKVDDGSLVWETTLKKDLNADVPLWGFSSHPLIVGDLLYTMVGGEGQGVVAFDKLTGDVKWKALDAKTGYCPPTVIEAGGVTQLIVFHPEAVASLNPLDGAIHWSLPITPDYEMSVTQPMVDGNLMYLSSMSREAMLIELGTDQPTAKVVWQSKDPKRAVHCSNSTPMFVDGIVYGTDCLKGDLVAVKAIDGTRLWNTFAATKPGETRNLRHGTAFVTRVADTDRYFLMSETGDLLLAKMTQDGFESLGRFHVLAPSGEAFGRDAVWSHPAYANLTAFVRNDEEIVAVDLAKP